MRIVVRDAGEGRKNVRRRHRSLLQMWRLADAWRGIGWREGPFEYHAFSVHGTRVVLAEDSVERVDQLVGRLALAPI